MSAAAPTSRPAASPRQRSRLLARLRAAHHEQAEEARGRGQYVHVPGGDQDPQQQRVRRPQQVRPEPAGRVGARQPVQGEHHRAERDRGPELQPEDDPRRRGAAEFGGGPLLGGGQRPVHGHLVAPLVADRLADRDRRCGAASPASSRRGCGRARRSGRTRRSRGRRSSRPAASR